MRETRQIPFYRNKICVK